MNLRATIVQGLIVGAALHGAVGRAEGPTPTGEAGGQAGASVPPPLRYDILEWHYTPDDVFRFGFAGDALHPAILLYEIESYDTRSTLRMRVVDPSQPAKKQDLATIPVVIADAAGGGQLSSPDAEWQATQAAVDAAIARWRFRPATVSRDVRDDESIAGPAAKLVVRLVGSKKLVSAFELDGKPVKNTQAIAAPADLRKRCGRAPITANLVGLDSDDTLPWVVAEVRFRCDDPESSDELTRDVPVVIGLRK